MIYVVSTGFHAPTRRLCEASVRAQSIKAEHIYIEAGEQDPPKPVTQNWFQAIQTLPHKAIVVLLDGDDWLAHPHVLEKVQEMYRRGALVTYGSYATADNAPGCCRAYMGTEYRREPWRASHLKTFRASLFQRLTPGDLQIDGEWITRAADMAVMFPLLEMAGPEHVTYCEEILCIYHHRSSFELNATREELTHEKECEMRIRNKETKALVPCENFL